MKNYTLILIGLLCLPFSAQAVTWSGTAGQNIIPLASNDGTTQFALGPSGPGSTIAFLLSKGNNPASSEMIVGNPGFETISTEDWIDYHATSNRWLRKKRARISSAANGSLLFKTPYIALPQALGYPGALNFSGLGVASSGGNDYFIQSLATDKFTSSGLTVQPIHQAIRVQVISLTTQAVVTTKTIQDNATWTLILGECFVGNIDDPVLNTDDDLVIVRKRTLANGNQQKQFLVYDLLTGVLVRSFTTVSVNHVPIPNITSVFQPF